MCRSGIFAFDQPGEDVIFLSPTRRGCCFDTLQESMREFSLASGLTRLAAPVLGVVNLGGALYLSQLLQDPRLIGVSLPGVYGFVQVWFY